VKQCPRCATLVQDDIPICGCGFEFQELPPQQDPIPPRVGRFLVSFTTALRVILVLGIVAALLGWFLWFMHGMGQLH
jgi:hypothetical protein